jgi:serine/threonine-protein kinase
MEMFCPACSRVYKDDAVVCEVDGERLVQLDDEPSLVGHVLDGKYTLLSKLGEGGMGSVYLAEQATMGREVAIKVLRREFSQNRMAIKRFLREARAASKLAHHNTITVYDFGQSNQGLLYLVMERLSGRPLADIMDDEGPLPPERAVHIVSQICDSLSEAHRQGITHRDLKPENIFIEDKVGHEDFVKVLDFGIAKMQGDEATGQATATGMICGTPSYMSPEQAMGKDIDGRSDIYALGVLLYELVTNEKPFDGVTPMEVMLKHINESPPNVYSRTSIRIPLGLQDALDRLLAKKAEQRPADCQAAKRLMQEGLGTPLDGPVLSTQDPDLSRRRREETEERKHALEHTGLSQTVAQSENRPLPTRRGGEARSRAWMVAGIIGLGAAVGALVIVTRSGTKVDPERSNPRAEAAQVVESPPSARREALEPGPMKPPVEPGAASQPVTLVPQSQIGKLAGVALLEAAEGASIALGRVTLWLDGEPAGAEVFEGTTRLGTLPLRLVRDRDGAPLRLQVRSKGYLPEQITVGLERDVSHRIALKRGGVQPQRISPQGPNFGTF